MKKIISIISIFILIINGINANPIDQNKAQCIGEKFLKTTSLGKKCDIRTILAYSVTTKGEIDYYIFNTEDKKGFVVVAGDDRVKPILAYSTEGYFSPTDIADGFQFTLNSYQKEIQYVRENDIAATPDIVSEWDLVEKTGCISGKRNAKTVDILLKTTWNQNYPYNSQCPEDEGGSNGHVYAGCVATAMGQVINYYNYPTRGTGSHSYTPGGWGYPSYPTQTADFGQTDYHFELMPFALDSLSTDDEVFYIAQLLHHLGISVDMMYGPNGSGAYSADVPYALHDYFGFSESNLIEKDGWWYDGYTNEEWAAALKGELDQNKPVFYGGQDDSGSGGHAFVCDGYDENDYFHFNWGWSGKDDAFCAIGALNTTKYAFNTYNDALIDLCPESLTYYKRPNKVTNLTMTENEEYNGVTLTWNNPSTDISGSTLSSIDSVIVRRNFKIIATFANAEPGAEMSFIDSVPESRIYEYSVFVKNGFGASIPVYEKILVGDKCSMLFQLNDAGGDGWKGASIAVIDENNNIIATVTMEDGASQSKIVPLLRGNLRFLWRHGWYHTSEEYDTDFECSFTIMDNAGGIVFTSPDELTDNELFSYNNDCESTIDCYAPADLTGVFYNDAGIYGTRLMWTAVNSAHHYNVYRSEDNVEEHYEKIGEVGGGTCNPVTYLDDLSEQQEISYYYRVTAFYSDGDETCESKPALALDNPENNYVYITTMSVDENSITAQIYPNPTNGMLNISAVGLQNITITNLMGQTIYSQNVDNNFVVVDMSLIGNGIYVISIGTANGTSLKKVSVVR